MTTLYLKYRPQKISDLDLTEVRELLAKIISSGNIPHAFLFEGPRGSGKTSAARIMAKVLNCTNLSQSGEPCNKCDQCTSITKGTNIDVIELDAASHRGIDDVRLIRESVKLAPAKAKKKVYIIDEAHMLTTEASNALLKTLEEPPEHVVFILATTNPEKLLDTIKSRTVRIKFKKASQMEIISSLENVLKTEKKKYDKKILELISQNVDGSFRDAKKILEEVMVKDLLNDLNKAEDFISKRGDFNIDDFFTRLIKRDMKSSLFILKNAENAGVSAKTVYSQVIGRIKELLFSAVNSGNGFSNDLTKDEILLVADIFITYFNKYQNDVSEYMPFYLSVIKWCGNGPDDKKDTVKKKDVKELNKSKIQTENVFQDKKLNGSKHKEKVVLDVTDSEDGAIGFNEDLSDENWKKILGLVRIKNASTEALLRASKPIGFDGKSIILGVYYKFHKEKLESFPHRDCLHESIQKILGGNIKVICKLTEQPKIEKVEEVVIESVDSDISTSSVKDSVMLSETHDDELTKIVDEVFGS